MILQEEYEKLISLAYQYYLILEWCEPKGSVSCEQKRQNYDNAEQDLEEFREKYPELIIQRKRMTEIVYGIEYQKPKVVLLQHTGLGVPELAARTCYDSFENSENDCIKDWDMDNYLLNVDIVNNIEDSKLLTNLAWVHHHHSILEHTNLSFMIEGTSRGVLQEHARHRIQAISVRSTRYTMSNIINAFVAGLTDNVKWKRRDFFVKKILELDMFVTVNSDYNKIQAETMWTLLQYQYEEIGNEEFLNISVAKSSRTAFKLSQTPEESYVILESGKKKRNVGDAFKHIVNDNWKVDMVVTFNIRSLKNYYTLRDSGAAYFQIVWLAKMMKEQTPQKYLDLMIKPQSVKDEEKAAKLKEQERIKELEHKALLYDQQNTLST